MVSKSESILLGSQHRRCLLNAALGRRRQMARKAAVIDGTKRRIDGRTGQTDGRTSERYIDSAPHTIRAVSKRCR